MRNRLRRMIFTATNYTVFRLFRGKINFTREVGDPTESSIVAAVLNWIARNFPEAPPMLETIAPVGDAEQIVDHPLLRLLQKPNEHYTGKLLWMASVVDWVANGEYFWWIRFATNGDPIELWWLPSWTIEPTGDEENYVSGYTYKVNGQEVQLSKDEVFHSRNGIDSENPRRGTSQLRTVLREIFTDQEAAQFTASILRNMGVPGILVSPDPGVEIPDADAQATKARLQETFSGDRRGEPLVMTGATRVSQFGFSPEQLLLKEIRRLPEERITAVTGIPAMVVGLGAGLDRSTFTNMGEAREAAYEAGLIPMQAIIADDIRFFLLPLYDGPESPWKMRFCFDLSRVRVLQEDLYRVVQRWDAQVRGGWATVAAAKRATGQPVLPGDDVYLRPANIVQVDAQSGAVKPLAPGAGGGNPNGNGNGNGGAYAQDVAAEVIAAIERREMMEVQ